MLDAGYVQASDREDTGKASGTREGQEVQNPRAYARGSPIESVVRSCSDSRMVAQYFDDLRVLDSADGFDVSESIGKNEPQRAEFDFLVVLHQLP